MELNKAIDIISAGKCHTLEWVSYDANRNRGGELKVARNVKVSGGSHDQKSHRTITVVVNNTHKTIHTGLIMKVNDEIVL